MLNDGEDVGLFAECNEALANGDHALTIEAPQTSVEDWEDYARRIANHGGDSGAEKGPKRAHSPKNADVAGGTNRGNGRLRIAGQLAKHAVTP